MLSSFCLKIFLFVIEAGSYLNHCSNNFFYCAYHKMLKMYFLRIFCGSQNLFCDVLKIPEAIQLSQTVAYPFHMLVYFLGGDFSMLIKKNIST